MLYVDGTTFAVKKKWYVTRLVYISDYIHRAVLGGFARICGCVGRRGRTFVVWICQVDTLATIVTVSSGRCGL